MLDDLATPQVNIAYGAYYLRYLLSRYGGNQTFALAAYDAGEGNVDRWIAAAQARDRAMTINAIPYAETRAYVSRVLTVAGRVPRHLREQLGALARHLLVAVTRPAGPRCRPAWRRPISFMEAVAAR